MNTTTIINAIKKATAAICLSILGAAFLIIAGLWPEDTAAVKACAVIGWGLFGWVVPIIASIRH